MPLFLYNYASAFSLFCQGKTIQEISDSLGIPLKTLKNRSLAEGWTRLAANMAERGQGLIRQEDKLEIIQANREANYAIAVKLREAVLNAATQLAAGTLMVPRLLRDGSVVQVPSGPADMVAIVTSAKSLSEMSYRAVGDVLAAPESGPAASQSAQQIVIMLPGAVATPRDARSYDPAADKLPQPAPIEPQPAAVIDIPTEVSKGQPVTAK